MWELCHKLSNLFVMTAASMSEQKSVLELSLSCDFHSQVCFLPWWINRVLFKGTVSCLVEITSSHDSVLDVETLCCLKGTLSHL